MTTWEARVQWAESEGLWDRFRHMARARLSVTVPLEFGISSSDVNHVAMAYVDDEISVRLRYLRESLRSESISTGELIRLQGMAAVIPEGDVELLEAAGVPEHFEDDVA